MDQTKSGMDQTKSERIKAGLALAKLRGSKFGRPRKVPYETIRRLLTNGLSGASISRIYGISESTVNTAKYERGANACPKSSSPEKLDEAKENSETEADHSHIPGQES